MKIIEKLIKINKHNNNDKLSKFPIHDKLKKLNLTNVMMDFDATSLHPSAKWDEKSIYLKTEGGFAFKPSMNDVCVEAFNNQTFNQDDKENAL